MPARVHTWETGVSGIGGRVVIASVCSAPGWRRLHRLALRGRRPAGVRTACPALAEVLATANQVERLEVDLETGQRGFIITGQERFLEPWNAARAALPEQSRTLEELVADNPVQESRARRIAPTASTPLPTMPVTKRRSTQSRG